MMDIVLLGAAVVIAILTMWGNLDPLGALNEVMEERHSSSKKIALPRYIFVPYKRTFWYDKWMPLRGVPADGKVFLLTFILTIINYAIGCLLPCLLILFYVFMDIKGLKLFGMAFSYLLFSFLIGCLYIVFKRKK